MQPTAKHLEVAATFRQLLTDHDIPSPDRVDYAAESVVFFWDEPRLAVLVDFDESASTQEGASPQPGYRR